MKRHKIVAYWGEGTQINSPVQSNPDTDGIVFRGRGHRLGGREACRTSNSQAHETESNTVSQQQRNQSAFRGRSHRLNE